MITKEILKNITVEEYLLVQEFMNETALFEYNSFSDMKPLTCASEVIMNKYINSEKEMLINVFAELFSNKINNEFERHKREMLKAEELEIYLEGILTHETMHIDFEVDIKLPTKEEIIRRYNNNSTGTFI